MPRPGQYGDIYRTDDGKWLVEHPPHGPITLRPFEPDPVPDG